MVQVGRRAVFLEPGRPLEYPEFESPSPTPGEMIVRVSMAGVCGTDAHRLDGDLKAPAVPIAFGHEGIGVIEELGHCITTDWAGQPVALGDWVYWFPSTGCRRCYHCTVQHDISACEEVAWPPRADVPSAAAFQDYATLPPAVAVYRIPEGTPPEAVIAFGCAMPTALGGLARLGPIIAGQTVVVQGSGPVGLAATLLAARSPAQHVVVIGGPAHRLAAARRVGATMTMDLESTSADERLDTVRALTAGRGADVVVEAAGQLPAFAEGLDLLTHNSRYLILGLYSGKGTAQINPYRLNNLSARIIGSLGSQPGDVMRTIDLASRFCRDLGMAELVTHRFPLIETEAAIDSARTGLAIKAVVEP
jgi:threonine dehydrogenase-like Zn-dependent dehydrogenase